MVEGGGEGAGQQSADWICLGVEDLGRAAVLAKGLFLQLHQEGTLPARVRDTKAAPLIHASGCNKTKQHKAHHSNMKQQPGN